MYLGKKILVSKSNSIPKIKHNNDGHSDLRRVATYLLVCLATNIKKLILRRLNLVSEKKVLSTNKLFDPRFTCLE